MIGQSVPRFDAMSKVNGSAEYPADRVRPNFLQAKVLFSNQPHARMVRMDTTSAETVPGIIAIFTAKDVPLNEYGLTMYDQPVFIGVDGNTLSAVDSTISRWEGDHIALIVAETEQAIEQAISLLEVEWEQLPILGDIPTALASDLLLHPENGQKSNAYYHYQVRKGDVAAGWAQAELIIEGTYHFPYQEHAYLQPEAAISYVDEEGRVTVEIAGQWTHEDQMQIAHALGLPLEQIRVIYPAIGGAFGGREDMSLQIVMALAAWKLHQRGEIRPIRTVWSREESIIGHHKRHRGYVYTRWGATKTGEIVAVEADCYLDAGGYNYTTNKVLGNLHICVGGPYNLPNARIDSYAVYTNAPVSGAFRGFGAPQGCFVAETQINKLAEALGMDAVVLRLKNCLRDGSIGITQTEMPRGVSLPHVIEACAKSADWPTPLSAPPAFPSFQSLPPNPTAIRVGRGFACAYKNVGFSFGFPERCEATIELYGSATIERAVLRHAGAEVGQGVHTVLRQMAASALDLPLERIETIYSDTAHTGDSGSVSASRMTWMAGNAIRLAAEKALTAWRDDEERPSVGQVRYTPPATTAMDAKTGFATPNFSYGYVAESAEIAIDLETGMIKVLRLVCANDVGKAINPQLISGQIEGAVVQAHGYTLMERLQVKDGHILNPRFSSYLIPGIMDIPDVVESVILEYPDPLGPWGVRGMAEMPFIPYAPAIIAALHNATGVWFDQFPLTPEAVLQGLATLNQA